MHKKYCLCRNIALLFLVIITTGFLASSAQAIGIAGEKHSFTFEKGIQKEFSYKLMGAPNMSATVYGGLPNLTRYVTLVDPEPDGGTRFVTLKFNLYEDLPPGRYDVILQANEIAQTEGGIAALTAVRTRVTILVLYPGKYLQWTTSATNTNVNESAELSITATSLGTDRINEIKGKFDIYDLDWNFIDSVNTESKSLESDTSQTITEEFDTTGLPKGNYHYNATLYWDGNEEDPKEGVFRIGSLYVEIVDYTKEFIIDAINNFKVTVQSDWSGTIRNVYAEIQTPNKNLKTPTIDLSDFRQGTMETYWDTAGLGNTSVDATITVFYEGQKTQKDVVLNINKLGEGVKVPEKPGLFSGMSTTTLILIILIIILAANVVFFLVRSMKKNEKKP